MESGGSASLPLAAAVADKLNEERSLAKWGSSDSESNADASCTTCAAGVAVEYNGEGVCGSPLSTEED
jgi:hypothetical protein